MTEKQKPRKACKLPGFDINMLDFLQNSECRFGKTDAFGQFAVSRLLLTQRSFRLLHGGYAALCIGKKAGNLARKVPYFSGLLDFELRHVFLGRRERIQERTAGTAKHICLLVLQYAE